MDRYPSGVRFWLVVGLIAAVSSIGVFAASTAQSSNPSVVLDQGWDRAQRHIYYFTSQGVQMIPAAWLEALQAPGAAGGRFMGAQHLARMGFIYANTPDTQSNPYHWPIGITVDHNNGGIPQAGITCSLCHSGQIEYHGKSVRIDGGSTTIDPAAFAIELQRAVIQTGDDQARLKRFIQKAVALGYPENGIGAHFDAVYQRAKRAQMSPPVQNSELRGPGRMDALSSISDNIFATALGVPSNAKLGTAPVNAPYLWDMWLFDFVQYNASSSGRSAMNRDIGQVIGQNGILQLLDPDKAAELLPEPRRWKTTIRPIGLYQIRQALDALKPPPWPEAVLGRINRTRAASGRILFQQNCSQCHGIQLIAGTSNPAIWHIPVVLLDKIGTDPNHAVNFAGFSFDARKLGLSQTTGVNEGLGAVIPPIKRQAYIDAGIPRSEWAKYDGGPDVTEPLPPCGYRARPLIGTWATGPFLHNGSVPTVYALLSETRPTTFVYGSQEFDPIKLGIAEKGGPGTATLDTRVSGNSNAGHWFTNDTSRPGRIGRAFSDQEKFAIIEYLKAATLADYPTRTVAQPTPPPCANSRQWAIDRLAAAKK
jgi:hypothetical protein